MNSLTEYLCGFPWDVGHKPAVGYNDKKIKRQTGRKQPSTWYTLVEPEEDQQKTLGDHQPGQNRTIWKMRSCGWLVEGKELRQNGNEDPPLDMQRGQCSKTYLPAG